jgi:hypothetical protein
LVIFIYEHLPNEHTFNEHFGWGIMQFLYARVSTSDQTAAHQIQQARAAGFDIDEDNVIKDNGVSGISTCFAERDCGRRLLESCGRATCWWSVGLTAWDAITTM